MFAALVVINLIVLAGLAVMAWSPKYGIFRGSTVNPLLIYVFFSVFFNINFIVLLGRGSINIFERAVPVTNTDVLIGYLNYTVIFIAAAGGMILAQLTFDPAKRKKVYEPDETTGFRLSRIMFLVVIAVGMVGALMIARHLAAIFSGRLNRQLLFTSNPLLTISYSIICPGLAIFLAYRKAIKFSSILAVLASMIALSVTGSRGVMILVGLIYLICLTLSGYRIQAYWYLVFTPVMIYLLAFSRFILRESFRFRSFGDFVSFRGGMGELFFNSSEVAMADAITVISNNTEILSRPPFENFLGLAMFPFPRAIFTFKPLGAAGYFTEALSPLRWAVTKSEILTTAYGELIMYYGLGAGALIGFVLAFIWLRACLRILNTSQTRIAIWLPFLIWWMYLFVRGSLFNVGGSMWPFGMTLLAFTVLSRIDFGVRQGNESVSIQ